METIHHILRFKGARYNQLLLWCLFIVYVDTCYYKYSELVGNENNIYLILERIELMKEKDLLAAKMVSKYMKLIKKLKNKTIKRDEHDYEKEVLTYTRLNFKRKCKELESTFPVYSQYDLIS